MFLNGDLKLLRISIFHVELINSSQYYIATFLEEHYQIDDFFYEITKNSLNIENYIKSRNNLV